MRRWLDPRLMIKVEALDEDRRYEIEERAAILEYDGGLPRLVAEAEAWKQMGWE
jgi:hypothetical protein